jgi:hypothetical protein
LIVPLKGIILINWSINTAAKVLHYSNKLSVTNESFIYVVKHSKSLIKNFKRGTSSPVCQNFLTTNSLAILVEKLNFKLLTVVRIEFKVWGQDKAKSKWLKSESQHTTVVSQNGL